jgi:hypothetical protein
VIAVVFYVESGAMAFIDADEAVTALVGFFLAPALYAGSIVIGWFRSITPFGASNWPLTTATIESVNVSTFRTAIHKSVPLEFADAQLAYSYKIDNDVYSGYFKRIFFDEQKAWDFAQTWKGKTIQVRYSPRDCAVSAMRPSDQLGAELSVNRALVR